MPQLRKEPLVNGECYHVFSRSIAKFIVFNSDEEYQRMLELISLYRYSNFTQKYSQYMRLVRTSQLEIIKNLNEQNDLLIEIIAYCLMPTHIHLLIKQSTDNGISKFMSQILNGYARYFNINHKRTGPLWAGRFKSVLASHDDQLLHLTRYLHLNPTSAGLVDDINDWDYSSYKEYVDKNNSDSICNFQEIIKMTQCQYEKFVKDHKNYQRDLSIIKHYTIDNYSG